MTNITDEQITRFAEVMKEVEQNKKDEEQKKKNLNYLCDLVKYFVGLVDCDNCNFVDKCRKDNHRVSECTKVYKFVDSLR